MNARELVQDIKQYGFLAVSVRHGISEHALCEKIAEMVNHSDAEGFSVTWDGEPVNWDQNSHYGGRFLIYKVPTAIQQIAARLHLFFLEIAVDGDTWEKVDRIVKETTRDLQGLAMAEIDNTSKLNHEVHILETYHNAMLAIESTIRAMAGKIDKLTIHPDAAGEVQSQSNSHFSAVNAPLLLKCNRAGSTLNHESLANLLRVSRQSSFADERRGMANLKKRLRKAGIKSLQ